MDISYNWLAQYVDHDLDPKALGEKLTMGGLEVEGIDRIGQSLDGVVVGRVDAVRTHPNADKLVLCDVDCGDGEPVQIACGADNVAAGQNVPVATPGTTLALPSRQNPTVYEPVTIEARTIRGEHSHGMICAEDELGLSEDHAGIMVLDDAADVGQPFAEYLAARGIDPTDAVFDIGLTPNRPDAASHFGVARDVAALTEGTLTRPDVDLPDEGSSDTAEAVRVDLQAPGACPRYVALLVRDVTVRASPTWLKRRLAAIGLRPRNNVVDVTNFVLHEIGQPLHAFDFDMLASGTIIVRTTEGEESFTTLDDIERTLPADTLLICDAERPVAIAGVMGGANSEVSATTTNVLIESAYFDPSTIRRTAKALNLQTDSSYRFERGVNRDGQVWAATRAAELIAELGDGTIVPGMVDAHPTLPEPRTINLRPSRLNALLGVDIPVGNAVQLLEQIGFGVDQSDDVLRCTVPTFRPDVELEVDLIEEVARLYGYDRIPEPKQVPVPSHLPRELRTDRLRQRARGVLRGLGFRETRTNSMLPAERAARFNQPSVAGVPNGKPEPVVETMNPISQEMATLRPTLIPGVLEVMQHNTNHGQEALRFFEFGHVFHQNEADVNTIVPGFRERETVLLALSGPAAPTHWDRPSRSVDFFDLKGAVSALLDALTVDAAFEPASANDALASYQLDVHAHDGTSLGTILRVADATAADFDLEDPIFIAELDWAALVERAELHEERRYTPVSRFPTVERDLAVLVSTDQPVGPLLSTLRAKGRPLLQDVRVFDIYTGEGISEDQKSVAIGLRFGANRTLKDHEVDALVQSMLDVLEKQHGATLRQ